DVDFSQTIKTVQSASQTYQAYAVLIATGASARKIGFPGESEFTGRGVAYCSTCDGEFFQGLDIFVIGGVGRSILVGALVTIISLFFVPLHVVSWLMVIMTL
ncbi:FAD-dependent oxidoreductase, partial [Enterococcus faecalis]|uniref:FAD-dependent oxidoreductase n=1 Tax=Enterococcus faecalis TaxID=1351 RepID=UPI001F49C10A